MEQAVKVERKNIPIRASRNTCPAGGRADKSARQSIKRRARGVLKRHYWFFLVLCLTAAFFGVEFSDSLGLLGISSGEKVQEDISTGMVADQPTIYDVIDKAIGGDEKADSEISNQSKEQAADDTGEGKKGQILGRSRGVLAGLVNDLTSGAILTTIISAVQSMAGSSEAAFVILIGLSLLLSLLIWFFFLNMYKVVYRRVFMEGRLYDEIPIQRLAFLIRVKKWVKVSCTMFLTSLFQMMWFITIIGGIIKRYSYFMVPYIVAENPDIAPLKAITMSREMMNGHKWECFVLECSYIGWILLRGMTLGITGIFYSNPYQMAVYCEYYAELRRLYIDQKKEDYELLNDRYLFEKASGENLRQAYADTIAQLKEQSKEGKTKKGAAGFIANVFGVTFSYNQEERKYQENEERKIKIKTFGDAAKGNAYPSRLSPIPEELKKKRVETLHYMRCYSICSLILLFFAFSFAGWVWEVSLHLISDGVFVNRGVMYGPWLPIYGSGGVLILVILNKFRSRPVLEFVTTIVLCGCVEYFTSLFLELTHDGQKWWDYSGYFLNLNGRICAEGLLVFGLGGMAIVYMLAPMLDNFIRKIPFKVIVPVCVLLLATFGIDHVYSAKHPNSGKGITDYAEVHSSRF